METQPGSAKGAAQYDVRMRSRLVLSAFVAAMCLSCSKSAGPTDAELRLPDGCTISRETTSGKVDCADGSHLSWIQGPSDGASAIAKDEGIIREAFPDATAEDAPCTLAGSKTTCRRVRLKEKTLALLSFGSIGGREYFVECAYGEDAAANACGVFAGM